MPLKHLISEAKGVPLDRQEDANDMGTGLKDLLVDIHISSIKKTNYVLQQAHLGGGHPPQTAVNETIRPTEI